MTLFRLSRCLLGHATAILDGETIQIAGCVHCGYVEWVTPIIRPEQGRVPPASPWVRDPEAIREREQRVARMGQPARLLRVVR